MPDITSDLKGHWTFDDSGATTADFSGNGNTGTLSGTIPPFRTGGMLIGQSMYFGGTSDEGYINIPANSSIGNLTSSFTIAVWVMRTVLGIEHTFFTVSESPSALVGFRFHVRTNDLLAFSSQDSNPEFQSLVGSVPAGVWTHIAVVFDSSFDATFFVNGVLKDTATGSAPCVATTTQAWFIGASPDNSALPTRFWFDGLMDDLRIYGRALAAADITALFNFTNVFRGADPSQFPKTILRVPSPQGRLL